MIYPIRRAIFNAAARGEYGGGRTQTDRWVLGRKNHFFEKGENKLKQLST